MKFALVNLLLLIVTVQAAKLKQRSKNQLQAPKATLTLLQSFRNHQQEAVLVDTVETTPPFSNHLLPTGPSNCSCAAKEDPYQEHPCDDWMDPYGHPCGVPDPEEEACCTTCGHVTESEDPYVKNPYMHGDPYDDPYGEDYEPDVYDTEDTFGDDVYNQEDAFSVSNDEDKENVDESHDCECSSKNIDGQCKCCFKCKKPKDKLPEDEEDNYDDVEVFKFGVDDLEPEHPCKCCGCKCEQLDIADVQLEEKDSQQSVAKK